MHSTTVAGYGVVLGEACVLAFEVLLIWTGLAVLALLVVVAAARSGSVEDQARGRREEAPASPGSPELDPA